MAPAGRAPYRRLCRPRDCRLCAGIARPTRDSSSASGHNPSSSSSGDIGRESDWRRRQAYRPGDSQRASTAGCPPMYGICGIALSGAPTRGSPRISVCTSGASPEAAWIVPTSRGHRPCPVRDSATRPAQSPGRHNRRCADVGTTPIRDSGHGNLPMGGQLICIAVDNSVRVADC
jgi:hypothetical protein